MYVRAWRGRSGARACGAGGARIAVPSPGSAGDPTAAGAGCPGPPTACHGCGVAPHEHGAVGWCHAEDPGGRMQGGCSYPWGLTRGEVTGTCIRLRSQAVAG